ncbi:MAG: methylmalonyl-CoA mutase family protein, partial [Bacteroidota bacterium]
MQIVKPYQLKHKVRLVTAGSLFDGHDAAINIMRRILQSTGAEIIHLGHNRSVEEIVNTAIQEDVQGIAITSYQGGHNEYFKYMYDLLKAQNSEHIKIFGGGGGTILPSEIEMLHKYGITRIYSPDDGREMGLQGMINDVLQQCDFPIGMSLNGEVKHFKEKDKRSIARLITAIENYPDDNENLLQNLNSSSLQSIPVLGITGTGGAGKSSLVDEIIRRYLLNFKDKSIAIISVDPSKRKTGGALLGDRIRMNAVNHERVYMRSLATRQSNLSVSKHIGGAVNILKAAGYDLIILETSGIGQSDTQIVDHSDLSLYVMTPEYGAATQLEKIDMLDFADLVAINKFDKRGALDALRDVKKQYQRNHNLWTKQADEMPVYGTIASQFNDVGTNQLFYALMRQLAEKSGNEAFAKLEQPKAGESEKIYIIPPKRVRYLSEISDNNRRYDQEVEKQSEIARQLFALEESKKLLAGEEVVNTLQAKYDDLQQDLSRENKELLEGWEELKKAYSADEFIYHVRNREIRVPTYTTSLSHSRIPRVVLPKFKDWGEILRWSRQENVPGSFPFTAGVFPFKRKGEDPTRMFAGEGAPERTNRRFHYLSLGMPANRLSTAFDSVTLYGEDPDHRPDIYGKVGNSGVNVSSLNDAKKLYSGFDLCNPKTSVSMTINGPAATVCAFFMNA